MDEFYLWYLFGKFDGNEKWSVKDSFLYLTFTRDNYETVGTKGDFRIGDASFVWWWVEIYLDGAEMDLNGSLRVTDRLWAKVNAKVIVANVRMNFFVKSSTKIN